MKIQKKSCFFFFFFWGGGLSSRGGGVGLGGQGDVNREVKFFVKIQKTNSFFFFFFFFFLGGGGVRSGVFRGVGGSQGGCEQRIEVFVKFEKKNWGGVGGEGWGGGGGQGRCNREVKFL